VSALTPRQVEVLEFMIEHFERHGCTPTLRELCLRFSVASTNSMTGIVHQLADKGFVRLGGSATSRTTLVLRRPDGTRGVPRLVRLDVVGGPVQ